MKILGLGILRGLKVTALNLIGSYYRPDRLVTVEYPEQRQVLQENTRNFPFLVYDGQDSEKGLRCVSCKICEKECPPQCIYIVPERDESGKLRKHPKIFDIDISVCMSCQICAEVCPFDAIKMDKVYELSNTSRFEALLLHKADLAKSNEYYHQIRPTEADLVDQQLEAERKKAQEKTKPAPLTPASPNPLEKPLTPVSKE